MATPAGADDAVDSVQPGPRDGRWTVLRPVAQFALAGVVAVLVVGVVTAVASRRVGQREAIVDARSRTLIAAQGVVEPAVTDGLLTGQADAVAKVDAVVRQSLRDRSLVRVKIWNREGVIVYSDEARLEGSRYVLGEEELSALDHGVIEAEVSNLSKPENRFEKPFGKLLEVYLPLRTPNGQRLLFEAYYRYDAVSSSGARIWRSFAPVSIGALVALELVQVPFAWSMARRLRDRQREREHLLQRALDASDDERRRIAADLHDGVVQDLAGVAYSLAGSARKGVDPPVAELFDRSAAEVRESIKTLRSLLVDIYPPTLADAGLESALGDLLAAARTRGVETSLDVGDGLDDLPEPVARLLYRAAQEGIRNVITHARATRVDVRVARDDGKAVLTVSDDGTGFDPAVLAERAKQGHVGLRGIGDLAARDGGRLDVRSTPGAGTTLELEVSLP
jgi:signal transduction histidine kinase